MKINPFFPSLESFVRTKKMFRKMMLWIVSQNLILTLSIILAPSCVVKHGLRCWMPFLAKQLHRLISILSKQTHGNRIFAMIHANGFLWVLMVYLISHVQRNDLAYIDFIHNFNLFEILVSGSSPWSNQTLFKPYIF